MKMKKIRDIKVSTKIIAGGLLAVLIPMLYGGPDNLDNVLSSDIAM